MQQIFCQRKVRLRAVYIHAAVVIIVIICVVSVNGQHRKESYELKTLPQHIVKIKIVSLRIIRSKSKYASRHGIHYIRAGSFHYHLSGEILRKSHALIQDIFKFGKLLLSRQLAEQQKIRSLFEDISVSHTSLYKFRNIISPVQEFSVTRHLFAVYRLKSHYMRYVSKPGQNPVTI